MSDSTFDYTSRFGLEFDGEVVIKTAFSEDYTYCLEAEAAMLQALSLVGFKWCPQFLGWCKNQNEDFDSEKALQMTFIQGRMVGWNDTPKVVARLKELHSVGITHHDVHCGNVLVDEEGEIFFIDFEQAKVWGDPDKDLEDMAESYNHWGHFKDKNECLEYIRALYYG